MGLRTNHLSTKGQKGWISSGDHFCHFYHFRLGLQLFFFSQNQLSKFREMISFIQAWDWNGDLTFFTSVLRRFFTIFWVDKRKTTHKKLLNDFYNLLLKLLPYFMWNAHGEPTLCGDDWSFTNNLNSIYNKYI